MIVPTSAQIRVRDAPHNSLLVLAPAGCGKTEALALRALGLVAATRNGNRILIATFTNRSRENVRERLKSYLTAASTRRALTVCNFHGLSARVIRSHGRAHGVKDGTSMPESDWVKQQCFELGLRFEASREVSELLATTKRQVLTDEEVLATLESVGDRRAIDIEQRRQQANVLTYDDLPRLAELILRDEQVAALYRSHFYHVLIDEFQDLTPQQLRIIKKIGLNRTTYAGDLAQGIYSFAGAAPEAILASVKNEVGDAVVEFSESHRSSSAVLGMVNALAPGIGGQQLTCASPSSWPNNGLAARLTFPSTKEEADYIKQFAEGVLKRAPKARIGVVARTKSRQRFVDAGLSESAVDSHRWDNPVLDGDAAPIVEKALRNASSAAFAAAENKSMYLRALIDHASVQDPSTREAVVGALDWAADEMEQGRPAEELSRVVGVHDGDSLLRAPGLHLLTAHAGKGQQFDWVFVVGLEEGCMPDFRATSDEARREEIRILSVMISRARHGVILTTCQVVPTNYGARKNREPSSLLEQFASVACSTERASVRAWLAGVDWGAFDLD